MATRISQPMREEVETQRFPSLPRLRAVRSTNSRLDGVLDMSEILPSRVDRAGFRKLEQTTCKDAVEEGSSLSTGSTSLQMNGLLHPYPHDIDLLGWREEDDGSVPFAKDMDIRDSDSDSFYSDGLHSADDEMEDRIFLDLEEENDMMTSEEEFGDCFYDYEKLVLGQGSRRKQMVGKYDGCEGSQHEVDGRMDEQCELSKKLSEQKVYILGDEDVVQVERGIVRNWAWANFSYLSQEEACRFVTRIVDTCVAIGMEFTLSPIEKAQAASTDIERTLVDLHGKVIDHLTKCGRKEEQLGLLHVILPETRRSYDKVESVCKRLGITFYYSCACEAMYPSKGDLKGIAREIQSKVVRRDARLRRLALPLVSEAPMLFFGADVFRCTPGDQGSDYISSVATSLDWPKFRQYTVRILHNEGTVRVSAKLGTMITQFISSFSKIKQRNVEKIILFRNGLKDGEFDAFFCLEEMNAIKTACTFFMNGYEPRITYVVVLPHEKTEMTNKSGTRADLTGYKFWCRHSGGKNFSALACYHVVHDENKFMPGELQSLTSKLCSIHDRRAHPEINIVPPAFYARHEAMAALEEWGRSKRLTKFQSN